MPPSPRGRAVHTRPAAMWSPATVLVGGVPPAAASSHADGTPADTSPVVTSSSLADDLEVALHCEARLAADGCDSHEPFLLLAQLYDRHGDRARARQLLHAAEAKFPMIASIIHQARLQMEAGHHNGHSAASMQASPSTRSLPPHAIGSFDASASVPALPPGGLHHQQQQRVAQVQSAYTTQTPRRATKSKRRKLGGTVRATRPDFDLASPRNPLLDPLAPTLRSPPAAAASSSLPIISSPSALQTSATSLAPLAIPPAPIIPLVSPTRPFASTSDERQFGRQKYRQPMVMRNGSQSARLNPSHGQSLQPIAIGSIPKLPSMQSARSPAPYPPSQLLPLSPSLIPSPKSARTIRSSRSMKEILYLESTGAPLSVMQAQQPQLYPQPPPPRPQRQQRDVQVDLPALLGVLSDYQEQGVTNVNVNALLDDLTRLSPARRAEVQQQWTAQSTPKSTAAATSQLTPREAESKSNEDEPRSLSLLPKEQHALPSPAPASPPRTSAATPQLDPKDDSDDEIFQIRSGAVSSPLSELDELDEEPATVAASPLHPPATEPPPAITPIQGEVVEAAATVTAEIAPVDPTHDSAAPADAEGTTLAAPMPAEVEKPLPVKKLGTPRLSTGNQNAVIADEHVLPPPSPPPAQPAQPTSSSTPLVASPAPLLLLSLTSRHASTDASTRSPAKPLLEPTAAVRQSSLGKPPSASSSPKQTPSARVSAPSSRASPVHFGSPQRGRDTHLRMDLHRAIKNDESGSPYATPPRRNTAMSSLASSETKRVSTSLDTTPITARSAAEAQAPVAAPIAAAASKSPDKSPKPESRRQTSVAVDRRSSTGRRATFKPVLARQPTEARKSTDAASPVSFVTPTAAAAAVTTSPLTARGVIAASHRRRTRRPSDSDQHASLDHKPSPAPTLARSPSRSPRTTLGAGVVAAADLKRSPRQTAVGAVTPATSTLAPATAAPNKRASMRASMRGSKRATAGGDIAAAMRRADEERAARQAKAAADAAAQAEKQAAEKAKAVATLAAAKEKLKREREEKDRLAKQAKEEKKAAAAVIKKAEEDAAVAREQARAATQRAQALECEMREADAARAQKEAVAAKEAAAAKAKEAAAKVASAESSAAVAGLKAALAASAGPVKIRRKGAKEEEEKAAQLKEAQLKEAQLKEAEKAAKAEKAPKAKVAQATPASSPTKPVAPDSSATLDDTPQLSNIFLTFGAQKVATLTHKEMEGVFLHYAQFERTVSSLKAVPTELSDKSAAVKLLASHICDGVMQLFRQGLRQKDAKMSPAQIEEMVVKERAFMLPGSTEDLAKSVKCMRVALMDTMDMKRTKKLTRVAWCMHWNGFASRWFKIREDGPLDCSIM